MKALPSAGLKSRWNVEIPKNHSCGMESVYQAKVECAGTAEKLRAFLKVRNSLNARSPGSTELNLESFRGSNEERFIRTTRKRETYLEPPQRCSSTPGGDFSHTMWRYGINEFSSDCTSPFQLQALQPGNSNSAWSPKKFYVMSTVSWNANTRFPKWKVQEMCFFRTAKRRTRRIYK